MLKFAWIGTPSRAKICFRKFLLNRKFIRHVLYHALRIDRETYSGKRSNACEDFQLATGKKSFDGENENKGPDVSRTKTYLWLSHHFLFLRSLPFFFKLNTRSNHLRTIFQIFRYADFLPLYNNEYCIYNDEYYSYSELPSEINKTDKQRM